MVVWSSRHHRKGLILPEVAEAVALTDRLWRAAWMVRSLNWWIGVVFALGAFLFALASVFILAPSLAATWKMTPAGINAVYFAGSIPFTTAAYLQLFQAANAGEFASQQPRVRQQVKVFGWQPGEIGWLSCALQFAGTILFNFNTFDAMIPSLTWFTEDLAVWIPNSVGAILFLLSGYLAFIETCHAHWAWRPGDLSWWIVLINLLGCLGFMASAMLSLVLPGGSEVAATPAVAFTLQGAVCFFLGALLMLPEATFGNEA